MQNRQTDTRAYTRVYSRNSDKDAEQTAGTRNEARKAGTENGTRNTDSETGRTDSRKAGRRRTSAESSDSPRLYHITIYYVIQTDSDTDSRSGHTPPVFSQKRFFKRRRASSTPPHILPFHANHHSRTRLPIWSSTRPFQRYPPIGILALTMETIAAQPSSLYEYTPICKFIL